MITLACTGSQFGLPEASPYVTKTEIHLRMAGLAYKKVPAMPNASPKGQLPFIEDAGELVADSTFIRAHIERKYGVDLDAGLDPVQRAQAWAIERMLENQLGWVSTWFRFMVPENFEKGPSHWFDGAPEAMRGQLRKGLLESVGTNLRAVGVSRHAPEEIAGLGERSLSALSSLLGDKPFLFGERPTGTDAVAFSILAGMLTPFFDSPLRRKAEGYANLTAYTARMMARFYPDHPWHTPAH
ncbi:glutathione S-transferase family protein [Archangium lipolyticum]|uniref:glutathione S-transferase family protein n=1 Tax=Archangium lipolyticum TaxID=2970465 RepID=UPI00214A1741|nr:glutathione S-transferase family protein [Archangium lipolyticum]